MFKSLMLLTLILLVFASGEVEYLEEKAVSYENV